MAFLPNLAGRLNDIEISSGAPVTETLLRRFGSNINLLLDFLGIADSSSSASGTLSDFISAVSLIEGHTIIKQVDIVFGAGVTTVGTYSKIKFVNRLFYARNEVTTLNNPPKNIDLLKQIDGGPLVNINAARVTPPSTTSIGTPFGKPVLGSNGVLTSGDPLQYPDQKLTSTARQQLFDGGLGVVGHEPVMRGNEWNLLGELSWREHNTAIIRSVNLSGVPGTVAIYMAYKLNMVSSELLD